MHDPLVVAFDIWRPWPQRSGMPSPSDHPGRWHIRHYHVCGSWCAPGTPDYRPHKSGHGPFPWWKPRSYSRFWTLAGRQFYWPSLVTIWHREPGGHDSGEVCKHTRRVWDDANRRWQWKAQRRWRWHVHHWHITVPPLQHLRRWLLTRCEWCGGRSRKGDLVNFSHSWDRGGGHWWKGERGLFHEDCSSVENVHGKCLCPVPVLPTGHHYGECAACGKFRPYNSEPDEADRLIAAIPTGGRITPDIRPAIEAAWAERRMRREAETPSMTPEDYQ